MKVLTPHFSSKMTDLAHCAVDFFQFRDQSIFFSSSNLFGTVELQKRNANQKIRQIAYLLFQSLMHCNQLSTSLQFWLLRNHEYVEMGSWY